MSKSQFKLTFFGLLFAPPIVLISLGIYVGEVGGGVILAIAWLAILFLIASAYVGKQEGKALAKINNSKKL